MKNKSCLLIPVTCLAIAFFPATAACALDWTQTKIEHQAAIGEPLPAYEFTFKNSGTAAVAITKVLPSCGCLASTLDKETVASGESGTITIKFDRTGLVEDVTRTVIVTTNEMHAKPYELTLRADLPAPLTLTPRLVYWKQGETSEAKTVDIKVNLPSGVLITRAVSNDQNFKVELVTLENGRHYRLDIAPRDTSTRRFAIIALQTNKPLPGDTALTIYAQVR